MGRSAPGRIRTCDTRFRSPVPSRTTVLIILCCKRFRYHSAWSLRLIAVRRGRPGGAPKRFEDASHGNRGRCLPTPRCSSAGLTTSRKSRRCEGPGTALAGHRARGWRWIVPSHCDDEEARHTAHLDARRPLFENLSKRCVTSQIRLLATLACEAPSHGRPCPYAECASTLRVWIESDAPHGDVPSSAAGSCCGRSACRERSRVDAT